MAPEGETVTLVAQLFSQQREEIASAWFEAIVSSGNRDKTSAGTVKMLRADAAELLDALLRFLDVAGFDVASSAFAVVSALASRISANHARAGLSPDETANFVLSIKQALVPAMLDAFGDDPRRLASELMGVDRVIDRLSLEIR
jgi:rsbT co-antagonist protein RsbR